MFRTRPSTPDPVRVTPWLLAGVLALTALLHEATGLATPAQRWLYDRAVITAPFRAPDDPATSPVALVLIDEASQNRHGRAPWPRDLHARLIDRLRGASVVVETEPMVGRESERALAELQHLHATVAADPVLARHPELPALLERSEQNLDGDTRLAESLAQHRRAVLSLGALPARDPADIPAGGTPPQPGAPLSAPWPLAGLRDAAAAVGHAEPGADDDGVLRRHALHRQVGAYRVTSVAALAAGLHAGTPPEALATGAPGIHLPADAQGRVAPFWGDVLSQALPTLGAADVLAGSPGLSRLQGRIVIIGRDDADTASRRVRLPDGRLVSPAEALARVAVAAQGDGWVRQPAWLRAVPWLMALGVLAYLLRMVPRLTTATALALSGVIAAGLLALSHLALGWGRWWLPTTLPVAALVTGHLGLWVADRWQWRRRRRGGTPVLLDAPMADTVITTFDVLPMPVASDTRLPSSGTPPASPVPVPSPAAPPPAPLPPPPLPPPPTPAPAPPRAPEPVHALEATQPLPRPPRPAEPEPAARATALPRLGRFRLERELGRGAMGRVYLARDLQDGRELAVKTLALAREFDGYALEEALARFRREALAAGRLHHPDIVRVLESGEEHGIAYIAMEHLAGHDLTHHLRAGSLLPVGTVVAIAARVASALAHAHAQGVIHRDIKPANVMIDLAAGRVKVTDFGIARVTGASRTRTGLVLGSPSYMSPEQLAGREVDGRSDLYSLGVVMYHMLTGDLPLSGHTMSDLIGAVAHTPAPDVRTRRPSLPEGLANVVGILLEKRPELRYRDGLELAADLRMLAAALQRRPAPEPEPAPPPDDAPDAGDAAFPLTAVMAPCPPSGAQSPR